jgi:hypothetical protein
MATAKSIITQALRNLGVTASGETASFDEANEALIALNQMMDVWSNDGMLIYHVTNALYTITPGVATYSIGPGATWDTSPSKRPMQLQKWGAFVRQTVSPGLTNDYKLEYWPNETYQNTFLKGQTTNFPSRWTYLPGYPIATVILWPVPTIALQMGISTLDQFNTFSNLTDVIELPPGYESALVWNLTVDLSPQYGIDPKPMVLKRAFETRGLIATTNAEPVYMRTDPVLEHAARRPFSIYTG